VKCGDTLSKIKVDGRVINCHSFLKEYIQYMLWRKKNYRNNCKLVRVCHGL